MSFHGTTYNELLDALRFALEHNPDFKPGDWFGVEVYEYTNGGKLGLFVTLPSYPEGLKTVDEIVTYFKLIGENEFDKQCEVRVEEIS